MDTARTSRRKITITSVIVIVALAAIGLIVTFVVAPHGEDKGELGSESQMAQNDATTAGAAGSASAANQVTSSQSQSAGSAGTSTASQSGSSLASAESGSQGQGAQSVGSGSASAGASSGTDDGSSDSGGSSNANGANDSNQDVVRGSSGLDFAKYDLYQETRTDEYGRVILTEAAAGKQLKDGVTYVVQSNVTLASSGYSAGLVANNNLIYIESGVTLNVKGANGSLTNPGLPAIALMSDRNLCISGEGTLVCTGGNAGNGTAGSNGGNGWHNDDAGSHGEYYSGAGGNGGTGGGGAGAGIGTAGGLGGSAGTGGRSVTGVQWTSSDDEANGVAGTLGGTGGYSANVGCLCVVGSVKLLLSGGKVGTGGAGGNAGSSDIAFHWYKYIAGAGGGGGGGGGGGAGNAYGEGGSGGNGGGGGGSGGCVYRRRGVSDDAPTGGGGTCGTMGGAARLMPVAGSSGTSGSGTKTSVTDVSGGDGAPWSFPSSAPKIDYKFAFLVMHSAKQNIFGTQCDGTTLLSECFTEVIAYTTLSTVANNNGWYVSNTFSNPDDPNWIVTFQSVIGATTAENLKSALDRTAPKSEGRMLVGWELVKSDGSTTMLYDVQSGTFNFAVLTLEKITGPGLTADKCVWMTCRNITVRAVWATPITYSVCYCSNKSDFLDPQTHQKVAATEYVVSGISAGSGVQLWNNSDRGAYLVSEPEDAANKELVWATGIDDEGEPILDIYRTTEIFTRDPIFSGYVYRLYACWVDKQARTDE